MIRLLHYEQRAGTLRNISAANSSRHPQSSALMLMRPSVTWYGKSGSTTRFVIVNVFVVWRILIRITGAANGASGSAT